MIGEPKSVVECDGCEDVHYYDMTPLASGSYDERNLKRTLERDRWILDGDLTFCSQECRDDSDR